MTIPSVDKLQNVLAESVFGYAIDKKKASGRALGTFVEIVAYYTLCAWGLRDSIAIEQRIPEFGNPELTHNVEFTLHPRVRTSEIVIEPLALPITSAKILASFGQLPEGAERKQQTLLGADRVLRNAAIIGDSPDRIVIANAHELSARSCKILVTELLRAPYAIIECKRVGVEEGMRKGPQTIEKAKQGAYVARTVSSLQRIRAADGRMQGLLELSDGRHEKDDYHVLLDRVIRGDDPNALRSLVLTVGVVSNHGNWFTSESHNKELRVLAQSYDWLLFLTDFGLCQFIEKLLLDPLPELKSARDAFLASYNKDASGNQFTKVRIAADADAALKAYFLHHAAEVEGWYNVIAPHGKNLTTLRDELRILAEKNWEQIRKA